MPLRDASQTSPRIAMAIKIPFLSCPLAASGATDSLAGNPARRARYQRWLLALHWSSSALSLLGMLLFAITGITLNHAGQIEARPHIERGEARLPSSILARLQEAARSERQLPGEFSDWLATQLHFRVQEQTPEWSEDELYLALPRPGGDAWLRVDLADGATEYEVTDRGWIAWLNDLHKGRHSGPVWSWFIDLFAVACLFFSLTGLLLLQLQATRRPATWPLAGFGVLLPLLIVLLFIH